MTRTCNSDVASYLPATCLLATGSPQTDYRYAACMLHAGLGRAGLTEPVCEEPGRNLVGTQLVGTQLELSRKTW